MTNEKNFILSCRRKTSRPEEDEKKEVLFYLQLTPRAHDEDDFFPFIEKRFSSHETLSTIDRERKKNTKNNSKNLRDSN